jgi:mannose/fructose/N-acetylgalactosamine-specific phosphotransferase system component IID
MYLIAIAWVYVVLLMAIAEATSSNGTVLGALFTFLLYGVLPLSIVLYIIRTPHRRRVQRAKEMHETEQHSDEAGKDSPPG